MSPSSCEPNWILVKPSLRNSSFATAAFSPTRRLPGMVVRPGQTSTR
jgi:hypothetical protein